VHYAHGQTGGKKDSANRTGTNPRVKSGRPGVSSSSAGNSANGMGHDNSPKGAVRARKG